MLCFTKLREKNALQHPKRETPNESLTLLNEREQTANGDHA